MKNKRNIVAFLLHLLLAVLVSLDWGFLGGGYLGFLPTFGLIYLLTLPVLVAVFAIVRTICAIKRKTGSLTVWICGALAVAVCMVYAFSALGVLAGTAFLPFAYFIVIGGTAVMLALPLISRFKN